MTYAIPQPAGAVVEIPERAGAFSPVSFEVVLVQSLDGHALEVESK
ncbi:hypothetical protein [Pseudarthrobacter sp. fls2-241-R2A-168]|nr:hypothetical protein [Pseudarthrobacter sp. fls2-241-R2A-168]